jgi:hypothetical protein
MLLYLKLAPYVVIGILIALLGIQTARLSGARETARARADRLVVYEGIVFRAKVDLTALREANQRRETEIADWKSKAEIGEEAMGLADSLAFRLALAEDEMAALDADRARLEMMLAPLPLCSAYLVTLQELARGIQ